MSLSRCLLVLATVLLLAEGSIDAAGGVLE